MSDFVLDNSVTMRWCFDSGTHAYADDIADQLGKRAATAFVPVLWRYEVSAVLARAEVKGFLKPGAATKFIENLTVLDIRVDDDSARRVWTDVHRLAVQYRLTSYDAAYLALAQRRALPLATLDDELRDACRSARVPLL